MKEINSSASWEQETSIEWLMDFLSLQFIIQLKFNQCLAFGVPTKDFGKKPRDFSFCSSHGQFKGSKMRKCKFFIQRRLCFFASDGLEKYQLNLFCCSIEAKLRRINWREKLPNASGGFFPSIVCDMWDKNFKIQLRAVLMERMRKLSRKLVKYCRH